MQSIILRINKNEDKFSLNESSSITKVFFADDEYIIEYLKSPFYMKKDVYDIKKLYLKDLQERYQSDIYRNYLYCGHFWDTEKKDDFIVLIKKITKEDVYSE